MPEPRTESDHLAFSEGDRVEVVARSACGDLSIDKSAAEPGVYRVFWPVKAGAGDDADGRAYYLLNDGHSAGGAFWAYPEHVSAVSSPTGGEGGG